MFEKLEDLAKNNKKISDFHIRAGSPLAYRATGEIIKVQEVMVTAQDLKDLRWDFTKAAVACNEGNMGIVLIVGEDRDAIMGEIEENGLVEEFPQVEVIVIGGISPYA